MLTAFTAALVALIPITNPVGALAVFSGMTASSPPGHTRRMAWRTGMWVAVILAAFALVGSLIMSAFGISAFSCGRSSSAMPNILSGSQSPATHSVMFDGA